MRRIAAATALFLWSGLALAGWFPLTFTSAQQAAFFAATGNDGNLCTQASPCLTIARANTIRHLGGSTINFNGGDTFAGSLVLTSINAPFGNVTIQSYGAGVATISSGNSAECIKATNVPAGTITNLTCVGGTTAVSTTDGVLIQNTGSTNIAGWSMSGLTVSGYGQNCVWLQAVNLGGFTGGTLGTGGAIGSAPTGAAGGGLTLHDCTGHVGQFTAGLELSAGPNFTSGKTAFQSININNLISFNHNGYAGAGADHWTGNAFWCDACTSVTVSVYYFHDVGANSNTTSGPGCGAFNFSAFAEVSYGEVSNCLTGNGIDGDGWDLDGDVTDSSIHHSYIHDCSGYGLFGFQFQPEEWARNKYYNNIVANCGLGQINIQATSTNSITGTNAIYNNTFVGVNAVNSSGIVSAQFYNNVIRCVANAVTHCINVASGGTQTFAGNDYSGFGDINYQGVSYSTLAAWQAATGQEKIAGVAVGSNVDPQLIVSGFHTTTSGYVPVSLPQYQLQGISTMAGSGIDVTANFGIAIGPTDFFGVALTSAAKVIGAGQGVTWVSGTGTCPAATTFIGRMTTPAVSQQQDDNQLICGFQVDGYTPVSFYNLASDTSTNAVLNRMSASFALTPISSPTFTAFKGFTGDGVTSYLASAFNPSTAGSTFVLNSAAQFFYNVNSRINGAYIGEIGGNAAGNSADAFIPGGGNAPAWDMNNASASPYFSNANADAQGFWINSRTGATTGAVYKNAVNVGSFSQVSTALPNVTFDVIGANASGTHSSSTDQQSIAGWGPGMTAGQAALVTFRIFTSTQGKGM